MTPCTLTRRGLNVIAVLDIVDTEDVLARFRQDFTHVVLVGSTGGAMWASMEAGGFLDRPHPVNDHAWAALDLFEGELRAEGRRTLRAWPRPPGSPGPEPSPLKITRLGELAGWGKRSPLGIGMHPRHGLWVGYRGVILVDGEFEGQRVWIEGWLTTEHTTFRESRTGGVGFAMRKTITDKRVLVPLFRS